MWRYLIWLVLCLGGVAVVAAITGIASGVW